LNEIRSAEEQSTAQGEALTPHKQNFEISSDEVERTNNITTLLADESVKKAEIVEHTDLLGILKSNARINTQQDIKSFLARPVVYTDGVFQSSDTVSTFSQIWLFDDLLSLPMFAAKVSGFIGFRGDAVFTLQANATRFTQGRYLLNFYPSGGGYNSNPTQFFKDLHSFSLTQRTQVPGIQIDLNTETQVTLKIPFVSSYLYYPIRSATTSAKQRNIGTVQIHPYVPANVATTFTLFVHFENVELFGPTVPQAGRKSKTEVEQDSKDIGPIESTARAVSKSTQHFKNIPVIGSFVEPVKWVSDLTAMVASAFGWSKPTISDTVQVFARHRGYQNVNVDGADLGVKMSLSVKNQVAEIPVGGNDLDEMAFDYIKRIPAFVSNVTWSTSNTKQSSLYTLGLGPGGASTTATDNGNTVVTYCPCSIPVVQFALYRGGFKVTLKLVKTEFHSGRLAVVFFPNVTSGLVAPGVTYASSFYANRHIIDVRYGTEWTFEFPFISEFAYLPVGQNFGVMTIFVENPLVASATVSSSVNILVEVSGLEDLEYAQPTFINAAPYHPSAPQAGGQFDNSTYSDTIGATLPSNVNHNYSAVSIGEKFTSYRQLLKRMDIRGRSAAQVNAAYTNIIPYGVSVIEGSGTPATPTYPTIQPDTYAFICSMFTLARGSVRIKLYDPTPVGQGSCFVYTALNTGSPFNEVAYAASDTNTNTGPGVTCGNLAAQVPISDGLTAEVQVPMYSNGIAFPICDTLFVGGGASSRYVTNGFSAAPQRFLSVTKMTPTATSPNAPFTMRGVGDDFSLYGFISVPPMIVFGVSTATNPYYTNGWS